MLWLAATLGLVSTSSGAALVARATSGPDGDDQPKIAGVYWTQWNSAVPLSSIPTSYNLVYLFAATRGSRVGEMWWDGPDVAADVRRCRERGQRVLLSLGGAGQGVPFTSRADCDRFVGSVSQIDLQLGGRPGSPALDGVDLNTFEGDVPAYATLYAWIAEQLRRRFGAGFLVTCPPAATSRRDRELCRTLLSAGALTYVAPQFYDGPGLSDPDVIVRETDAWVDQVAGGDAGRVVVGFGIDVRDLPDYSSIGQVADAWSRVLESHPGIGGAYLWQHHSDAVAGWPFARRVAAPITDRAFTEPRGG